MLFIIRREAITQYPRRRKQYRWRECNKSHFRFPDTVVLARQTRGDAVGNGADGQAEEDAEGAADAAETAVGDGPVVWWGGDYGGEGVGDKEGSCADENAVGGDGPENLLSERPKVDEEREIWGDR